MNAAEDPMLPWWFGLLLMFAGAVMVTTRRHTSAEVGRVQRRVYGTRVARRVQPSDGARIVAAGVGFLLIGLLVLVAGLVRSLT